MSDLFDVLLRHFFGRFFDNELVSRGGEMHTSLSKIIGLLATPGLLCFWLMPKYVVLSFQPIRVIENATLPDKLFFITFSMVVMGFVTVLEWDALFPDRRDFTILIPLPIRLEAIFAAKIVSLCAFVLVFFTAANAISTFMFPFVSLHHGSTFASVVRHVAVHAMSVLAGTAFIFFFFVALQGLLMNLLSFRAFRRASTYAQLISVFALLMMLLLFLDATSLMHSPQNRHWLYFFPPSWFLGLYETMLGQPDPLPGSSVIAVRALALVTAASAFSYALAYKRHVKRSLESEEILDVVPGWISSHAAALWGRLFVRKPLEQAAFYFTAKTIVRSRKHWLYLAAYVGVGFALVLQGVMGAASRRGGLSLGRLDASFLSIPLVLSFFILSGMRFIFTLPAELRANWVFQLSEADGRKECLAGVRKAMFTFGVLPLLAALAVPSALLWGPGAAIYQAVCDAMLCWLLIEVLLINFYKIPFTCSFLPGKAQLTTRWFFYWIGFATYAYTMASLEAWSLQRPSRMVLLLLSGAALVAAAAMFRNRILDDGFRLVFEEEPEPAVLTLKLSVPGSW